MHWHNQFWFAIVTFTVGYLLYWLYICNHYEPKCDTSILDKPLVGEYTIQFNDPNVKLIATGGDSGKDITIERSR